MSFEVVKNDQPHYQEILLHYKVNPCTFVQQKRPGDYSFNNQACHKLNCFNYHHSFERRRPVFDEASPNLLYQTVKCPSVNEKGVCAKGESCKFAHTQNEVFYHPFFYKMEPCKGCIYENNSKFCPYYHSDETSRQMVVEKAKAKLNREHSKNQPNSAASTSSVLDPFDLENFKAAPCPYKGNHNPKVCDYYHHDKDRKRPVGVYHYSSNQCRYTEKGQQCPNGDNCTNCHNKVEQLYHVERYKRKFCLSHPHNIHKCEYGNFCSFAHSEKEIKIELLHNLKKDEDFYLNKFKTVFCPYIYEHDRNQCVYAHNPQDLRRSPQQYNYAPVQCPLWSQRQIFSYEEGGCPKQMQCEQCHGWKELEYHPMYYKTKPCNNGKKCNKKDCPFYHNNNEKRDPQPIIPKATTVTTVTTVTAQNPSSPNSSSNLTLLPAAISHELEGSSSKAQNEAKKQDVSSRLTNKPASPQAGSELKEKRNADSSTRTNSNNSIISAIYFNIDDPANNDDEKDDLKKKKTKKMSLQGKKERAPSPFSAKSDKPQGQFKKGNFIPLVNIWKFTNNDNQDGFEDAFNNFESDKVFQMNKNNDSFESFQSLTIEKNLGTTEKGAGFHTNQFVQNLFSNMERRGLKDAIPHLQNSNLDVGALRSFNQKDFHLLPQVTLEDKERLVKIIEEVLEEEAILMEINNIHEANSVVSSNQNVYDENGFYGIFNSYDSNQECGFSTNLFNKYP